jgi:hypothetical protein
MKFRRTDDPDVCYMSDPVQLWANGVVEFRIDLRNGKFLMTPIMRDKSEGAVLDATEMYKPFLREQGEHGSD